MKNLITALSVLTLGTTVGNLSSSLSTNEKISTINTNLNQSIKKINSIDSANITAKDTNWNYVIKNNLTTINGGENYYNWYFVYHVIGLSHKTLGDVNNALGGGIGAVSAVLAAAVPALAPILAVVTPLIIAQWYLWEIADYDQGNGVIIKFIGGTVPQIIVGVSSQ